MDGDAHDKADRALEVVRELHKRYEAQDQRWHNYSKLVGFICFAGLLLAVLYLQRDAHVLYQVHSTIAASVLPGDITSPSDVLGWLQGFLQVRMLVCAAIYRQLPTGKGQNDHQVFCQTQAFGAKQACGYNMSIESHVTVSHSYA